MFKYPLTILSAATMAQAQANYFLNEVTERDNIVTPNYSVVSEDKRWQMDATVAMQQETEGVDQQPSLHFTLTAKQLPNKAGTYDPLPDNSYLQTFIQIRDEAESSTSGLDYYENYTGTIKYVASELGKIRDQRFLRDPSCGTGILGEIDGKTYSATQAVKEDCGYYLPDFEAMFVQNSQQNGVSFRVAYSRKFEEFGL